MGTAENWPEASFHAQKPLTSITTTATGTSTSDPCTSVSLFRRSDMPELYTFIAFKTTIVWPFMHRTPRTASDIAGTGWLAARNDPLSRG